MKFLTQANGFKLIIAAINFLLGSQLSYFVKPKKLDSRVIFIETQGPYTGKEAWRKNGAWQYDPMQVANKGDDALDTVRTGKENTDLLSTQVLRNKLSGVKHTSFYKPKNSNRAIPDYRNYHTRKEAEKMTAELSIETGIIWLFRKAISKVDNVSVPKNEQIYSYTIQKGDSYSKIAGKIETTVTELEKQNGKGKLLKIGKELKYRKASMERRISSNWRSWNQAIQAYNSRDGYYDRVNTYYQKLTKGEACFGVSK